MHLNTKCGFILEDENISDPLYCTIADKAAIRADDYVLDICCDDGKGVQWLAAAFPGLRLHVLRVSTAHIQMARRTVQRKGLQFVDFSVGSPCKTGFPDAQFTVVWACGSGCQSAWKRDFYKEAYRVLQPGGRLVIAAMIRNSGCFPLEDELRIRDVLAASGCPVPDTWEAHYRHIVRAGFTRFQMQDMSYILEPVLAKYKQSAAMKLPLWKRLTRLVLKNENGSYDNAHVMQEYDVLKKGLWAYGIVIAIKPWDDY